jgi:hypothetical protein
MASVVIAPPVLKDTMPCQPEFFLNVVTLPLGRRLSAATVEYGCRFGDSRFEF